VQNKSGERLNLLAKDLEQQTFEHLADDQLAACRKRLYAVWPNQIDGHVRKQRKKTRRGARAVGDAVRPWPGLLRYPSNVEVPSNGNDPSHSCQDTMGTSTVQQPAQLVVLQSADHVRQRSAACLDRRRACVGACGRGMAMAWADKAATTIQDGETDEASPWLEQTGWQPYLMGLERPDLLTSIEEPSIEEPSIEEPRKNESISGFLQKDRRDLGRILKRIGEKGNDIAE
jgi:hypothetical protein